MSRLPKLRSFAKNQNILLYSILTLAMVFSGNLAIDYIRSSNHQNFASISYNPDHIVNTKNSISPDSVNQGQKGKSSRTPCYTNKSQSGMMEANLLNCKLDKNNAPKNPNKILRSV